MEKNRAKYRKPKKLTLEQELKKLNIRYWKTKDGYYLDSPPEAMSPWFRKYNKPLSERMVWKQIQYRKQHHRQTLKEVSKVKDRATTKQNIIKGKFEDASHPIKLHLDFYN